MHLFLKESTQQSVLEEALQEKLAVVETKLQGKLNPVARVINTNKAEDLKKMLQMIEEQKLPF